MILNYICIVNIHDSFSFDQLCHSRYNYIHNPQYLSAGSLMVWPSFLSLCRGFDSLHLLHAKEVQMHLLVIRVGIEPETQAI